MFNVDIWHPLSCVPHYSKTHSVKHTHICSHTQVSQLINIPICVCVHIVHVHLFDVCSSSGAGWLLPRLGQPQAREKLYIYWPTCHWLLWETVKSTFLRLIVDSCGKKDVAGAWEYTVFPPLCLLSVRSHCKESPLFRLVILNSLPCIVSQMLCKVATKSCNIYS